MRIQSNESDLKILAAFLTSWSQQPLSFEIWLWMHVPSISFHDSIPYLLELPDYCNTKLCNCFALITPSKEVRNIDGRKEALNQAESLKVKPQAFRNKPIDSRWLAVIESHVDRECAVSFLSPWATRNKLIEERFEENVLNRVDFKYVCQMKKMTQDFPVESRQKKLQPVHCIYNCSLWEEGAEPRARNKPIEKSRCQRSVPIQAPPTSSFEDAIVSVHYIHYVQKRNTGPNIQNRNPHNILSGNRKLGMND